MPQMALGVHPHAFRSSAAPPNRQFAPADQYLFCPGYRPAAWLKCFASGWQAPASAPTTVSTRPIRVVTAAKRRGVSLICVHFLSAEGSSAEGSAQRGQPDLRSFPVEHNGTAGQHNAHNAPGTPRRHSFLRPPGNARCAVTEMAYRVTQPGTDHQRASFSASDRATYLRLLHWNLASAEARLLAWSRKRRRWRFDRR